MNKNQCPLLMRERVERHPITSLDAKVQPSVITYSTLLDGYAKAGKAWKQTIDSCYNTKCLLGL